MKYKNIKKIYLYLIIICLTLVFLCVKILINYKHDKDIVYFFVIIVINLLCVFGLVKEIKKIYICNKIYKKNIFQYNDIKRLFREQRHDFMNYFQIIYGYLELGKIEESIKEIKKIINVNANISRIYNISVFSISLLLDKKVRELGDIDLNFNIYVKNKTNYDLRAIDNELQILHKLDIIFDYILDGDMLFIKNKMLLEIEELDDRISFNFRGNTKINMVFFNKNSYDFKKNDNDIKIIFRYQNPRKIDVSKTIYSTI